MDNSQNGEGDTEEISSTLSAQACPRANFNEVGGNVPGSADDINASNGTIDDVKTPANLPPPSNEESMLFPTEPKLPEPQLSELPPSELPPSELPPSELLPCEMQPCELQASEVQPSEVQPSNEGAKEKSDSKGKGKAKEKETGLCAPQAGREQGIIFQNPPRSLK